jgi:hypothetical protein
LIFDMKANARLNLLLLSMIFSVVAFVFIYSSSSDYHAKKTAIDATIKEGEEFILFAKKEKVDLSSKLAFESKRNEELGSDLEALRLDLEEEQKEFAEQQERVAELQAQIEAKESIVLNAAETEEKVLALKKEATERTVELSRQIPILENKLSDIKNEEDDARRRIAELETKLADYELITNQLREHFSSSLKGIREYTRERPWIEPGDVLSTALHTIDPATGTIALSIGADDGIQDGMLFKIVTGREEVGRLKINQVKQNEAVGTIIPLHGNPRKLQRSGSIDLINL